MGSNDIGASPSTGGGAGPSGVRSMNSSSITRNLISSLTSMNKSCLPSSASYSQTHSCSDSTLVFACQRTSRKNTCENFAYVHLSFTTSSFFCVPKKITFNELFGAEYMNRGIGCRVTNLQLLILLIPKQKFMLGKVVSSSIISLMMATLQYLNYINCHLFTNISL